MPSMIVFVVAKLRVILKSLKKNASKIVNLDYYQRISMAKNRNLNSIQKLFWRYRIWYKFLEGNLMTNLAIELLLLIGVLVNFGAILTAKIYSKSVKEIQRRRLFCSESTSNPYCIFWSINSKLITFKIKLIY